MREIWLLENFPISFDILEIYHQLLKIYNDPLEPISEAIFTCLRHGKTLDLETVSCHEFFEDLELLGDGSPFDPEQISRGFKAILLFIQAVCQKKETLTRDYMLVTVHLAKPCTITLVFKEKKSK